MKKIEDLVGKTFNFYGVNCNCFKLNGTVWEAIEDEEDGWRSSLDSVVESTDNLIFPQKRLARVTLEGCTDNDSGHKFCDNTFEGWQLKDVKDGHIWLRFGTDHCDYWYPYFVFDYQPKEA